MTTARLRTASLLGAAALSVVASGCGAGGFASDEPTRLDTSINSYVALGDGFAAAPYVGKTTAKDGCLRSSGNYPSQVAKALSVNEFTDVTCFGATTKSITQGTKAPGRSTKLAAQIKAVDRDTDLITLGIGIEDRDMLNTLFNVCLQLPCTTRIAPPDLQKQLDTFEANLTAAVRDLQEKAPSAYIVLVGYPQLMPAQDPCAALPALTAAELDGAFIVLENVNNVVRSAAQQTGGIYINAAALSANHDACSDDPWVSDQKTVPGKQKAFHPLAPEQKAIAHEIAVRVRAR